MLLGQWHFPRFVPYKANFDMKLIWFLAPSVALSEQHYTKVVQLLPAYQIKLLVGSDKLDKWTDQWHWDAILANVEIVVGTPKVLEEALEHGFVSMTMLSLLVFDEGESSAEDRVDGKLRLGSSPPLRWRSSHGRHHARFLPQQQSEERA